MTLWWLEPGWTDALCMTCGVNIHASGGDPDWGYCYGCFTAQMNERRLESELEDLRKENELLRGQINTIEVVAQGSNKDQEHG